MFDLKKNCVSVTLMHLQASVYAPESNKLTGSMLPGIFLTTFFFCQFTSTEYAYGLLYLIYLFFLTYTDYVYIQ